MRKCIFIVITAAIYILNTSVLCAQVKSWVQDSFQDFISGTCSASGIDLYVSKDGTIKSINRYDLNNDGFLDLVFNSGHELRDAIPPTLYTLTAGRSRGGFSELPVDGAKQVVTADFNKDGFDDVVFLPSENGVSPRRYLSLLWGDEKGWSNQRKTQLISISARKGEVGDLNGDSWPDLLVLNGSRWSPMDGPEQVLRVYWGGKMGFQQNSYRDIVLSNAVDFVVSDMDKNDLPEVAILSSDPGKVSIFWNVNSGTDQQWEKPQEINLETPSVGELILTDYTADGRCDILITGGDRELIGQDPTTGEEIYRFGGVILIEASDEHSFQWNKSVLINAPAASDIKVSDLDGDGNSDIVLADVSGKTNSVHILWGNNGPDRSDPEVTTFPLAFASAIDIGDLDGDEIPDIAIAAFRTEKEFSSNSTILFGEGDRKFSSFRHPMPSAGATDILIIPATEKAATQIIIANTKSGRYLEDTPSKVYWGTSGGFDVDKVSLFDIRSGYTSAAADLNGDGYSDLVLLSIVHAVKEPHPGIGFNILWGGPDGLQNDRRTILNEYGLYDISIADINKDGFLDLIGSVGYTSPDGLPPGFVVWRGSQEGFSAENRIRVESESRPTQHVLADFNKDGYFDMALLIGNKHKISIFWGEKEGFSESNMTSFPFLRGGDMKSADLNGDGWLDLVASSLLIPNSLFYDFGTYIFWGGEHGFDPTRAQKLIGHGTVGITIADWDRDGFLDVFLPSYKYTETRESVASHLYWGGKNGFSDSQRRDFMQNSGHGAMAGDFNGDGKMDLAISNHRTDGDHTTNSQVYYASDSRFKDYTLQYLPTIGSEFIYSNDPGSQYNRTYEKVYTSTIFEWKEVFRKGDLEILARHEGNTSLKISVRSAESKGSLETKTWEYLGSHSDMSFEISPADRYMQYRLTFISDNGDRYPEVAKVGISLSAK